MNARHSGAGSGRPLRRQSHRLSATFAEERKSWYALGRVRVRVRVRVKVRVRVRVRVRVSYP